MNDEINLELFTLAIVKLNNAFARLNEGDSDIADDLDSSYENLVELHDSVAKIISDEEVNDSEVEPFFIYSMNTFPSFKDELENCQNIPHNLNESIDNLIEVFDKLYNLGDEYFKNRGVML